MELTETEKEVRDIVEQRQKLGRQRYGEGCSFKQSDSVINWVTQAIEEAADQLTYLVALRQRLKYEKDERIKRSL